MMDAEAEQRQRAFEEAYLRGRAGDSCDSGDSRPQRPSSSGRRAGDFRRFVTGEQNEKPKLLQEWLNSARAKLSAKFKAAQYPTHALGPLAEACTAIAEEGQMEPAMAGQCLIANAALLTQARANVKTLAGVKPLSLYVQTVGDSGDGKSTAEEVTLRPIDEWQRAQSDAYKAEIERVELANESRKKGEPKPEVPREPYIKMKDGTVEGIRRAFKQGLPSQGVFSSEAAMMLAGYGMNAENRAKSAANFNCLWDSGEISVARGLDGRLQLYDRRLSLHWLIQPNVARSALHDPLLATIGFWPRFLTAWPAPSKPQTACGFDPEKDSRIRAYWKRCRQLLEYQQGSDCRNLLVIGASPEALKLIAKFFERMQQAKLPGSPLFIVRAFSQRAPETLFRIAGVLSAWSGEKSITVACARNAMALATYSLDTWRGIFGERDEVEARAHALELYEWILNQPGAGVREAAILHIGPKPIRSKSRRDTALATLEQAGLVERERDFWFALIEEDDDENSL